MIELDDYREKVLGCWMGKNIGGTLGAPFEWKRQVNDVKFYTQELGGNPLPNDDIDIQLLWLIALEEKGINLDARLLGEYWLTYVTPYWAEYGNAKINMKSGLVPPLSGMENNFFKDSCGAFIRSEIWACIAPGCPKIAVRYAYEDAIIDHGNGEGVFAEVFCTALESSAFIVNDIFELINIGLSYIPKECGVARAINNVLDSYKAGKTWLEARDELLRLYRGSVLCGDYSLISKDDLNKGYADGKMGWDAPGNIGMMIIGLLYGGGDFEKSICITVNCGEDTDCTAATVGAIFGIMNGIDAIPGKWIEPIGRKVKTVCLNIGELGYFGDQLPQDIDDLTDRIERIAKQIIWKYDLPVEILKDKISKDKPVDISGLKEYSLLAGTGDISIYKNLDGPIYRFDFFDVMLNFIDGPVIKGGGSKKIKMTIENKYKIQEFINIQWYTNDNWEVRPYKTGKIYLGRSIWPDCIKSIEFELFTEKVKYKINRFVIELTIDGRHTVMLVPVVLLNEY